jgi:hypothetical protein
MKRTGWLVDSGALILLAVICATGAVLGRLGYGPWARR